METVASLVEYARCFSVNEVGNTLHKHFESDTSSNGVVVMNEDDKPIGLIMRTHFYQMVGTQFGYSIYMNRPIELLMKKEILCLDVDYDLAQFGFKAMNRQESDVFDYVIILKDDKYHGVVSISKFLSAMSEIKQREIELLNTQQKILEEAHEQEKSLRQEIEVKRESIKKLLDNADQGFLSFHDDLMIYEEHSSICQEIFQQPIARKNFGELMNDFLDEKQHKLLLDTMKSIFAQKNKVRTKVFLRLLPEEFTANDKYIQITYKIISYKPTKILMVILTDITDKKALETKSREEKNNMKLVLSAINNKTEILEALDEAHEFFNVGVGRLLNQNSPVSEVIAVLFRVIHTMKGDFALRLMHNTALNLHTIEDRLSVMLGEKGGEDHAELKNFMQQIDFDELIRKDQEIIKEFLSIDYFESEKNISINYDRLETLISSVENRFVGEDQSFLISSIQELTYPALNSILTGYTEYIQILALKLDKSISDFEVTGDVVFIDRNQYSNFLKSVIHIFRNIVDHGIEKAEERVEKGKDETGRIVCNLSKNNTCFTLEISDDGKGIDPEVVKKVAESKGVYTRDQLEKMSEKEIVNTIFEDSFSTRCEVSMLSGRGVGLSAVKSEVESLNGTIEADSYLDEGTSFRITLPLT